MPDSAVYRARRAQGLCGLCGVTSATALCPECAKRKEKTRKRGRRLARKDGRCSSCVTRPARPGMRLCEECTVRLNTPASEHRQWWNVSGTDATRAPRQARVRAQSESAALRLGTEALRAELGSEPANVRAVRAERAPRPSRLRRIGGVIVRARYDAASGSYHGYVRAGEARWDFEGLLPPPGMQHSQGSRAARDTIARCALEFAVMAHEGPRPSWAPSAEVAAEIARAAATGRHAVNGEHRVLRRQGKPR